MTWLALMAANLIIFLLIMLAMGMPISRSSEEFDLLWALDLVVTLMFFLVLVLRWIFQWRNFKRSLFFLACVATLVGLFYAEEDWRGRHDWEQFKRAEEAKGEKLDFEDFIPPAVPDEQNFAMSPICVAEVRQVSGVPISKKWYGDQIYSQAVSNLMPMLPVQLSGLTGTNCWSAANAQPDLASWNHKTNLVDLRLWQKYYRGLAETNPAVGIAVTPQPQTPAADVLLALSKYERAIDAEREASHLPFSRFPVSYDDANPALVWLPHLAVVRRHCQVLHLRAVAELAEDRPSAALADAQLMGYLINSVRDEPFPISQAVRAICAADLVQVVGQGLAGRRWTPPQLADLDAELASLDFLSDVRRAMKGEAAFETAEISFFRRTRNFDEPNIFVNNGPDLVYLSKFVQHGTPGGWFYESARRHCQFIAQHFLPTVDPLAKTVSSKQFDLAIRAARANLSIWDPLSVLDFQWGQNRGEWLRDVITAQAVVDLARTAMALERYRLAKGEYPEALSGLAPQFIANVPQDIFGGAPLHYRRTDVGQFVLYSVGWNEQDDGGVVVFKKGSTPEADLDQGDWVWRYPAK